MKKSLIFLFLVLMASTSFAGKGLTVTQKYTTGTEGQSITVTWYVTESQCKLKMQFNDKDINTTSFFIPDLKTNKLLTYNDAPVPAGAQKVFFGIPVQDIKADVAPATIERTGETKEIAGITCEKVIAKTANTVTEMWVTKDFKADYFKFASFFKSSYELKALSDSKLKGFPLSSVTKDSSGKTIAAYELVSASSGEVSDSEFKVPAEYKSSEEAGKAKN